MTSIQTLSIQILLAILSVVLAELIRDTYHVVGHYWRPVQALHNMHHKVYRRDLSITSLDTYKKAQLYNDAPEATVMMVLTAAVAIATQSWPMAFGSLYSAGFLMTALARSQGLLMETDLTHKQGDLTTTPSQWVVNRTYHWRHHFDQGNAYYCGTFSFLDKAMGTALSLKGKVVAVTGASGALGRSLIDELNQQGARVVALTSSADATFETPIEVLQWRVGEEESLRDRLKSVDILIINHGVNVYGDRSPDAIQRSYEINTFSAWRLMELFLSTVTASSHRAIKEVWINTSEAEVGPALSPLYELSKRTIGELITLRRLDTPCVIRKLILGPFKSSLNPYGILSPRWVAWAVIALAKRDIRNIIVTINPLTLITFPLVELSKSLYFRLFSKSTLKQVP